MSEFDPIIGYKVVTPKWQSLGLRKNPNILTFTIGARVTLPPDQIVSGSGDWGGIWVARTRGAANQYIRYMREQYDMECLILRSEIGIILFKNSIRVKTDSVLPLEVLPNPSIKRKRLF